MCTAAKAQEALKDFLYSQSKPLDQSALLLVERAKGLMAQRFIHGYHQLVAVGLDERGRECVGIQQDVPIGQASTCAEIFAAAKAVNRQSPIVTLVTVHHKRPDQEEGERIHVVPPCGLCRERLLHLFPNCQVIIWLKGELRMLPIAFLLPVPYKTKRPGENGGHAISEFDDQ